jgi:hypothetical protein
LDIKLSARTPDLQAAVEALIDHAMRHHTIDNKTFARECSGHPLVTEAYGALERLTKRSDDSLAERVLDHVRESFEGAMRTLGNGFCSDLFLVQTKLYSMTNRISELENHEIAALNSRLLALQERSEKVSADRIAELENHVTEFNSLAESLDSAQWTVQKLENVLIERTNEIAALNSRLSALQERS